MRRYALVSLLAFASPLAGAPSAQPPVLIAFSIGDSSGVVSYAHPVLLTHRVSGTLPTHYRVSTRADFRDSDWIAYQPRPEWTGPANGERPCSAPRVGTMLRLFFQVRVHVGQEVRIVNGQRQLVPASVESNVLADSACIVR